MRRLLAILALGGLVLAACGDDSSGDEAEGPATTGTATTGGPTTSGTATTGGPATTSAATTAGQGVTVTLVTHDSFAVTEELLTDFETRTGITIEVLAMGDAGQMVSQLILTKDDPLGDVVFGIDNTLMSRALDEGLFVAYESPLLGEIADDLELDPEHRLLPVDRGDVCLNYDVAYFEENGLEVPSGLAELTDPAYEGLLVVENPATSSPGLAFLLATVAEFGDDGWKSYWEDLAANDVAVQPGWEEAYYGDFTVAGGGDRPLVVSYASSPPAEVIFADPPVDEAPTGVIAESCFGQIEFTGILDGTDEPEAAQQVVDFLLSREVQEDIPLNMFVFPANETASLPPEFVEHTVIPDDPLTLEADVIDENRETWIEEWNEIVVG
jgi:thiamine transport system substrate-binding protein